VDAVSYGISVLTSRGLTGAFASAAQPGSGRGLWAEAFDGLRMLWRDSFLRAVLIQAPLLNFAINGALFTVILGLRRSGSSAAVIGGVLAVIMLGGIVGAVLAPQIRSRVTVLRAILLLSVSGTVLMLVAAAVMPSPAVAVPLAIPFIFAPAANAALFAIVLRRTPAAAHGRVNAGLLQVAGGLSAIAPIVSGLLVQRASASWAFVFFAASLAVVVPLALLFPATAAEGD
jgi:hypothetical protein